MNDEAIPFDDILADVELYSLTEEQVRALLRANPTNVICYPKDFDIAVRVLLDAYPTIRLNGAVVSTK